MLYFHFDGVHTYQTEDGPEKVARIVPVPANYPAAYRLLKQGYDVQLGTPRVLERYKKIDGRILYDEIRPQISSLDERHGGWHSMTRLDMLSFQLAWLAYKMWYGLKIWVLNNRNNEDLADLKVLAERISEHMCAHPLYDYLQPYGLSTLPVPAGLVIGIIGDPRWFVDVNHPERSGPLKRYFGLDRLRYDSGLVPESFYEFKHQNLSRMRYHARRPTEDAFSKAGARVMLGFDPLNKTLGEIMNESPLLFFRAQQAELARVLLYIRLTWLSLIYPDQEFIPEKFFKDEVDVLYYRHNILCV